MLIKKSNDEGEYMERVVEERDYASKGVAGTGLGFGIAGTALALLNNGGCGLGGLLGGGNCNNNGAAAVAQSSANMACMAAIAAKDAEIGQLKAERYTDMIAAQVMASQNGHNETQYKALAALDKEVAVLRCELAAERQHATCQVNTLADYLKYNYVPGHLRISPTDICPAVQLATTPTTPAA